MLSFYRDLRADCQQFARIAVDEHQGAVLIQADSVEIAESASDRALVAPIRTEKVDNGARFLAQGNDRAVLPRHQGGCPQAAGTDDEACQDNSLEVLWCDYQSKG